MKDNNVENRRSEVLLEMETCVETGVESTESEVGSEYPAYVGMDVHKDTIVVAVAREGRSVPDSRGRIANTKKAVKRLIRKLSEEFGGEELLFCYEAGPCGYVLYHQITEMGHICEVVAPTEIPKKPGERVKTDRRDARKLARLLRSGDLTSVWVPNKEREAMRDLTRARDDFKSQEHRARMQLNGFVLRHGHAWPSGKKRWTEKHYRWLESIRFESPLQEMVLNDYIEATKAATERVRMITAEIEKALPEWSMAPVVYSLMALRGVAKITAIGVLAELGDISRFTSPKQLMGYLGLVPSEHSSGSKRRKGAITKTGNRHVRRLLVESAWSYRFLARQTAHLKRKAKLASPEAKTIAWKAQKRLCSRHRTLINSGKMKTVANVAVARELTGFIWDIVRHEMPKVKAA